MTVQLNLSDPLWSTVLVATADDLYDLALSFPEDREEIELYLRIIRTIATLGRTGVLIPDQAYIMDDVEEICETMEIQVTFRKVDDEHYMLDAHELGD